MKIANDGIVYGPVWLSKGERFRPTGAYIYLELRYKELNVQLKKCKQDYKELMIIIKTRQKRRMIEIGGDDEQGTSTDETDKDEDDKVINLSFIQDKSLLSLRKKEMKELQKVKKEN
jgi:hypothetical protein